MPRKEMDESLCRELHARIDEIEALIGDAEDRHLLLWFLWNMDLEIVCRQGRLSENDPRGLQIALERRMSRRGTTQGRGDD